jgi:hypothetical protein
MRKTAMRLSPQQRTVVDPLHYEKNQNGGLELSWAALVETAFHFGVHYRAAGDARQFNFR